MNDISRSDKSFLRKIISLSGKAINKYKMIEADEKYFEYSGDSCFVWLKTKDGEFKKANIKQGISDGCKTEVKEGVVNGAKIKLPEDV